MLERFKSYFGGSRYLSNRSLTLDTTYHGAGLPIPKGLELKKCCPPWIEAERWRTNQLAQLKLYSDIEDVQTLLDRPSDRHPTLYAWLQTLFNTLHDYGNAYVKILRNTHNVPRSLVFIHPKFVEVEEKDGVIVYTRVIHKEDSVEPEREELDKKDLIHFRDFDDGELLSPSRVPAIEPYARQWFSANQTVDYNLSKARNPLLLLKARNEYLTRLEQMKLQDNIEAINQERDARVQSAKGFTDAIDTEQTSVIWLPSAIEEVSWLETPAIQAEGTDKAISRAILGIAAALEAPPFVLGSSEQARYSDTAAKYESAIRDGSYPALVNLEQMLMEKLLTRSQRKAGGYIRMNPMDFVAGSLTAMSTVFGGLGNSVTRGEVRQLLRLDPEIEGADEFVGSAPPRVPSGDPNAPFADEDPDDPSAPTEDDSPGE